MSNELSDLATAHAVLVEAQDAEREIVHRARHEGFRWSEIAAVFGLSVSTTQYRFGEGVPQPEPLPGRSVPEHAARVHISPSYVWTHLNEFPHVVIERNGQRRVRILEDA